MVVAVVAAVFVAVVCFVAGLVVAWLDAVVACLADPVAWFVVVAAVVACFVVVWRFVQVSSWTIPLATAVTLSLAALAACSYF